MEINHSDQNLNSNNIGKFFLSVFLDLNFYSFSEIGDKSKADYDHTCSESKTHSITDSPMKDEHCDIKDHVLSKNTELFSEIIWKFMVERYVPYLSLLQHCKTQPTQYGVHLRNAFNEFFSDLLCKDLKALRVFCQDNGYDKLDIQVLHFGIKLMYFLTYGVQECASTKIKQLDRKRRELDTLYNKVIAMVEIKQDDETSPSSSLTYVKLLTLVYNLLFSNEEDIPRIEELEKDANLPALKLVKSIIGTNGNYTIVDKVLDKIADKTGSQLGVKRKRNDFGKSKVFSQDPEEMIRNIRRRRSNKSYLSEVSMGGTDSPNFASMGLIEPRLNIPKLEDRMMGKHLKYLNLK